MLPTAPPLNKAGFGGQKQSKMKKTPKQLIKQAEKLQEKIMDLYEDSASTPKNFFNRDLLNSTVTYLGNSIDAIRKHHKC